MSCVMDFCDDRFKHKQNYSSNACECETDISRFIFVRVVPTYFYVITLRFSPEQGDLEVYTPAANISDNLSLWCFKSELVIRHHLLTV